MGQQVDLVDQADPGGGKHGRILQRLILTLGHADNHHLGRLAQIEHGRTDQITHVLDQKQGVIDQLQAMEGPVDHLGIQVAAGPGVDLDHRGAGTFDPLCIQQGLLVTLDHRQGQVIGQSQNGLLQQGGFARTR